MGTGRLARWPRAGRMGALVVFATGLGLAGCLPPPPPPPTVVVYGDSLVAESEALLRTQLEATLPGWRVILRSLGGTAQCDWHASMIDDADRLNVRVAILAFSGNSITPCSTSRLYPDSYFADATWAASFFGARGIPLAFVVTPGAAGTLPADRIVPNVYRFVGTERSIPVVESDDLFVDPETGRYELTGPCLVGECVDRIAVRAADGGHLCGVLDVVPCPVYASGVVRYTDGIVRMAAILALHTPPPGRVLVVPTTTSSTTTSSTTTSSTTGTTASATARSATGIPEPGTVIAPGVVYPTARPGVPYSPLGDRAPAP